MFTLTVLSSGVGSPPCSQVEIYKIWCLQVVYRCIPLYKSYPILSSTSKNITLWPNISYCS